MSDYDLIVIGGGPGGYAAAIRASQLGKRTACVEVRSRLGGTCLNVGCIPSKALLASSRMFEETQSGLAHHGIKIGDASIDVPAMLARKEKIVGALAKGIDLLLRKNGVERIEGWATVPSPGRVNVSASGGERILSAKAIVLATGSTPMTIPGVDIDERRIVTSTGALSLEAVPKRMIVVGAGVIGLELGQVWSRLGAEVTVVEYLDRALPGIDAEIAKTAQRLLSRCALKFVFGHKVLGAEVLDDSVSLLVEKRADGSQQRLEADVVLVAIGRRPAIDGIVSEAIQPERDARGFLVVDPAFRTTCPGVYAIGDCVPGPMLAHKAEHDAIACAEAIAGVEAKGHSVQVPAVVYTHPEIASVGQSEDELRLAGADIAVGKFHFLANSRARVSGEADGLVKVIADRGSGRIVGAHIIGTHAGELISEFVIAMARQSTLEDIASACYPHPSFGEACKEACLAALGRALHA